jgi:hypothetical protein
MRTAFEKAEEKESVPGAAALLRELATGGAQHRICFISGSPRQMRKVLEQKLALDGVRFDEFILKPNMSNFFRGRFRAIREQVGYKLPALLAGRVGVGTPVGETLFGDDAEGDAFIYSLYADILAGRTGKETLEEILTRLEVYADVAEQTLGLMHSIEQSECVRRIFIRLDKHSPPARFDRYGGRLVPVYNYFQAAAVLYQDGILDASALVRVALDMVQRSGYEVDALCNSYQDLVRRGRVRRESTQRLGTELAEVAALGHDGAEAEQVRTIVGALGSRVRALGSARAEPATTISRGAVDYLAALEEDPPRRKAKAKAKKKK